MDFDAKAWYRSLPSASHLVERPRLLSEAFTGVLDRRRMELSLAERLRFEKLLSSLAAAFSHLSATDFAAAQRGLRQVVAFLGVDRGSLVEFTRSLLLAQMSERLTRSCVEGAKKDRRAKEK